MNQAILSGLAVGGVYVLMSIGFALEMEIADIVNAAHGAFVVGGMYLTITLVSDGIPVLLAVIASAAIVAALSYPVYKLLIQPARAQVGHRVQLVFTLLLLSLLTVVYQLAFGADLRSLDASFGSVSLFGGVLTTSQIVAIILAVVVSVVLYAIARFTYVGKLAYVASRYPTGARSIGTPVARIYTSVFVIGGALAGLAGGVIVTFQPVTPTMGLDFIVVVFLVAVVARTHLLGCLILGMAYGVAQSVLNYEVSANLAGTLTLIVFLVALSAERGLLTIGAVRSRLRKSTSTKGAMT